MKPVRSLLAGGNVTVLRNTLAKARKVNEAATPALEPMDIQSQLDMLDMLDRMRLAIIAATPAPVISQSIIEVMDPNAGPMLAEKDATIATLRTLIGDAEDRATQSNTDAAMARNALNEMHATFAQMEAAHAEAMRTNQRIVEVPGPPVLPPRSADITIKPTFGMTGLLQRVVLSAKGYDTVTLDVDRAPDGTIKQLKERTP